MLYSHRPIEISIVVNGQGIHKLLGQAIPCKAGDIYIVNSNVPHRYFTAEPGKDLTVRRILFDPADWLEKEAAQVTSAHYCCGVFSENPIASYAMLTQRMQERVLSLFDSLTIETIERKSEWRDAVKSYLSLIMIAVKRYVNTAIKSIPQTSSASWTPISAVLSLVNENYGDRNTI